MLGRFVIDSGKILVRACNDEIAWYSIGTCGIFVCFLLIHACHPLGIRLVFYLLAKCPHLSRCLQNGQKMPRRSERSERSAFVSHAQPWSAMARHDQPWLAIGKHGQPWLAMGSHEQAWSAIGVAMSKRVLAFIASPCFFLDSSCFRFFILFSFKIKSM